MADVPIGVVLVNWNGTSDTLAALESLWNAHPRPGRVAVVDNASSAESVRQIQLWIDGHGEGWAALLVLGSNTGFAGGNNAGLAVLAKDLSLDSFLLLNNDAVVEPDFFSALMRGVSARPDGALYTTTIYAADHTTVWYAGGTEHRRRALVLHSTKLPQDNSPVVTEFVCGCVMLIPRRTYTVLGGLSEVYFPGYWEDAEYSLRGRETVGPLIYIPDAVAHHKVGASAGRADTSPRITFIQNHHRAVFVRRNFRGTDRVIAIGYLLLTKPARFVKELLKGNVRVGFATLAGAMRGIFLTDPDLGLDPKSLGHY